MVHLRYILIDKIQKIEYNKQLTAIKNITLSDDIFSDHFLGNPVMPGALLIECAAQAGTALLEISSKHEKKALLVMVEKAKFRIIVHPGDQLVIVVDIISKDDDAARLECSIKVSGKLVAEARLTFSLHPSEEFYPPDIRNLMLVQYNIWLRETEIIDNKEKGE